MGQRQQKASLLCFICSFFIIFTAISFPTRVSAGELNNSALFKNNNILFYNPFEDLTDSNCPDGTLPTDASGTLPTGNDNPSVAVAYFVQNGYSTTAAAAIVGNFTVESGVNPKKLQGGAIVEDNFTAYSGGKKNFSGGFGLAQWTSDGRVEKLQKYANDNNLAVTSLQAQLGFALSELKGSYANYVSPDKLNNLSLDVATFIVRRYYEGPAAIIYSTQNGRYYNDYVPSSLSEVDQAKTPGAYGEWKKAYEAAGALVGIDTSNISLPSGGSDIVCPPKPMNDALNTSELIFYDQCDPKWKNTPYGASGTACSSGCGPTSFAVIATNLLRRSVTPDETTRIAGQKGMHVKCPDGGWCGSSHDITSVLGREYGLEVEHISGDIQTINKYLDQGAMIHTSGSGSKPFTRNGHYIAIVGKTSDGKWIVADSSRNGPSGTYTPSAVISAGMSTGNVWAVRKK